MVSLKEVHVLLYKIYISYQGNWLDTFTNYTPITEAAFHFWCIDGLAYECTKLCALWTLPPPHSSGTLTGSLKLVYMYIIRARNRSLTCGLCMLTLIESSTWQSTCVFAIVFMLMKLQVLICWYKKPYYTLDKSLENIYLPVIFQAQKFITCMDH